jgi:hypothetical protein
MFSRMAILLRCMCRRVLFRSFLAFGVGRSDVGCLYYRRFPGYLWEWGLYGNLSTPETDQLINLIIGNIAPLESLGLGDANRQVKHITTTQELFGSGTVQDSARVNL